MRRGIEYIQPLVREWWQKWLTSYLSSLQGLQKWRMVKKNFQKRDLVLLIDAATPPVGRYPYAVVLDVKACKGSKVRTVTVRMSHGRFREKDISKLVFTEAPMKQTDKQSRETFMMLKEFKRKLLAHFFMKQTTSTKKIMI